MLNKMKHSALLKVQKPETAEADRNVKVAVNQAVSRNNVLGSRNGLDSRSDDYNGTSCSHPKISSSVSFCIPTK